MIMFVTTFPRKLAQLSYHMKNPKVTVNNASFLLPTVHSTLAALGLFVLCLTSIPTSMQQQNSDKTIKGQRGQWRVLIKNPSRQMPGHLGGPIS